MQVSAISNHSRHFPNPANLNSSPELLPVIEFEQLPRAISNLSVGRDSLTPYLYPQAMRFYDLQTGARWEAHDISYAKDVLQWVSLDPVIKKIIGGVLRGFVQTELIVGEYWSTNVGNWFPHPDIKLMSTRFGDMEGVHAISYNQLSVSLGLDSYKTFKADPIASAKIGLLLQAEANNLPQIARSLAVFSALTEGVILFSSFAILQWLKTKSLLPGLTSVIEYSVKDECLHSTAGCWLFNTLLAEDPSLDTPELRGEIESAAIAAITVEHSFIDSVFQGEVLEGLDPEDLKQFILARANQKLSEIGSKKIFIYDEEAAERINSWFDLYNGVAVLTDNFAKRSTNYTKGVFKVEKKLSFA
jgi:ribonucleoside-diphosphate reductase beta chain